MIEWAMAHPVKAALPMDHCIFELYVMYNKIK